MPKPGLTGRAVGLPIARLLELHDCLVLALDASASRVGYSQAQREFRSYTRAALRHTRRLLGDHL